MAKRGPATQGKPTAPSAQTMPAPEASPASSLVTMSRPRKTERGLEMRTKPGASDDEVANELLIVFGENLSAARIKAGLRQSELAAQAGLSQQYLSRIEMGRQNVAFRTMVVLAGALGQEVVAMLQHPTLKR
jgi:DNA-binding XRE family transcriptional regulator